ncbi:hypothetical protein FQA47_009966 [Oryzias melastigma]|uniref:Uncharacterized protein n=1 Tax=Oryzias melastigma TaxID=30732 RepID=A0A834CTQ0_ORYME|nr:hypothetical protein FQA47_009966 [Oryzias melastigma]
MSATGLTLLKEDNFLTDSEQAEASTSHREPPGAHPSLDLLWLKPGVRLQSREKVDCDE